MKYKILKIAKSDVRKKLLAFGMTPSTIVVMVRGSLISIRSSEWDTLTVTKEI